MAKKVELFEKVCRQCGKVFRTDNERVRLCLSCKEHNKKLDTQRNIKERKKFKIENKKITKSFSLLEITRLLEKYNKEHGTKYTYGQFVKLISLKQIELKE